MPSPFEFWASPEPTVARIDATTYRDQLDETGHATRIADLDLIAGLGVSATRYPVLWERTAPGPAGTLDLSWAAPRLERLRALGVEPIVTLLHHGSGPPHTNLLDPAFPASFAAYAGAVAAAFPWVRRWTPLNEPLTTARFSTLYGTWFPNLADDAAFARAIVNSALAMLLGMHAIAVHVRDPQFVLTEDLQSFTAYDPAVAPFVAHKRERMYLSAELAMGRVRPGHALYGYLRANGVEQAMLERLEALAWPPDLIAWNYYPNSERALDMDPAGRIVNEPQRLRAPISPRPLLRAAHERLQLPFALGEVHCNADEGGRVRWLRDRFEDLRALASDGLPVRALGAWAAFGMVDWHSLLVARDDVREDGVFTFAGRDGTPQETAVAVALRELAA